MDNQFDELFLQFRQQYTLTNPPPELRSYERLGWEFILSMVWALATVIMVASQTASEFYQAKILSGMDTRLAFAASVAVLIAVEGGLVIGAAIKASGAKSYNRGLVAVAIALCVLISIAAGLNSSVGIIPNLDPKILYWMRIGLVFALGIFGSLMAWASGEVLGAQIAKVFVGRDKSASEYRDAMQAYNEQLLASWRASPEYTLAKSGVRMDADRVRAERNKLKVSESFRKDSESSDASAEVSRKDYRKLQKAEKRALVDMEVSEIMDTYGLIERTAYNWKSNAERDYSDNGHGGQQ